MAPPKGWVPHNKIPHITLPTGEEGKVCTKCGAEKPLCCFPVYSSGAYRPVCKSCCNSYASEWKKANPDKVKANTARWYANHAEEERAFYASEENRQGRERLIERLKAKYRENPSAHNKRTRAYYQTNKEKIARQNKSYQSKNRLRYVAIWQKRRARKMSQGGSFTAQEFADLCARYGNQCFCCLDNPPLTADHVVPLSKGGSNDISNIQPLCRSCNSRKGTKTIDYRLNISPPIEDAD